MPDMFRLNREIIKVGPEVGSSPSFVGMKFQRQAQIWIQQDSGGSMIDSNFNDVFEFVTFGGKKPYLTRLGTGLFDKQPNDPSKVIATLTIDPLDDAKVTITNSAAQPGIQAIYWSDDKDNLEAADYRQNNFLTIVEPLIRDVDDVSIANLTLSSTPGAPNHTAFLSYYAGFRTSVLWRSNPPVPNNYVKFEEGVTNFLDPTYEIFGFGPEVIVTGLEPGGPHPFLVTGLFGLNDTINITVT